MDTEFVCIDAETQEFAPFSEYVRRVVMDAQRALRAFMRDNGIDPLDPLAVKAFALLDEHVTTRMHADLVDQIAAARCTAKH